MWSLMSLYFHLPPLRLCRLHLIFFCRMLLRSLPLFQRLSSRCPRTSTIRLSSWLALLASQYSRLVLLSSRLVLPLLHLRAGLAGLTSPMSVGPLHQHQHRLIGVSVARCSSAGLLKLDRPPPQLRLLLRLLLVRPVRLLVVRPVRLLLLSHLHHPPAGLHYLVLCTGLSIRLLLHGRLQGCCSPLHLLAGLCRGLHQPIPCSIA